MPAAKPSRSYPVRAVLILFGLFAVLVFAVIPQAEASWMSGRAADASGTAYLAVLNDNDTGERIELNCTPNGQAFLALTWRAARAGEPGQGGLTLRFVVDGSRRFAAPARFRQLDKGWAAAELDTSDILGPLTEALSLGRSNFEIAVVQHGTTLATSLFDMDKAPENIGLYRSYCRM